MLEKMMREELLTQAEDCDGFFSEKDFTGLDLSGLHFDGAVFIECCFSKVQAVNTEFFDCTFNSCTFEQAKLHKTTFNESTGIGVNFADADLSKAIFFSCVFAGINLQKADLSETQFTDGSGLERLVCDSETVFNRANIDCRMDILHIQGLRMGEIYVFPAAENWFVKINDNWCGTVAEFREMCESDEVYGMEQFTFEMEHYRPGLSALVSVVEAFAVEREEGRTTASLYWENNKDQS